jgi:hypothetical protein
MRLRPPIRVIVPMAFYSVATMERRLLHAVAKMMDRPGDLAWAGADGGGPQRQAADWAYLADSWHHLFDEGYFTNREWMSVRLLQLRARDIILSMELSA